MIIRLQTHRAQDETLIVFNSLLNGTYAASLKAAEAVQHRPLGQAEEEHRAKELKGVGDDVMDLVFMLADTFLGYK